MTTAKPQATFRFAAFLAFLSMLGPFTVDAYLPAFTQIGDDLAASKIQLQQTLSAYFIPFALMTLVHGPLADAFGRRRLLLAALLVFVVGSIGCTLAPNIEALWIFRFLQGASAGGGVVILYAVTRDCFQGPDAHRMIAQSLMTYNLAPALAPIIGGFLLEWFGWRSVFAMLALLATIMLFLTNKHLPETLPAEKRQPLRPRTLIANYRSVVSHRDNYLLSGALAFSFAGGFLYIASASAFMAQHLNVSSTGYGWLFFPLVGGCVVGAFVSGQLATRLSMTDTVAAGFFVMVAAAGCNLLAVLVAGPQLPWSIVPLFIYAIGQTIAAPALKALLIDRDPGLAGTASAFRAGLQLLLLAFTAGVVSPLASSTPQGLALGMIVLLGMATCCLWRYQVGLTGFRARSQPRGHF